MPRIRPLTAAEGMNIYLLSVIEKYMRLSGVKTRSELGPLMGKCESTAVSRFQSPGKFQFSEIQRLVQKLRIPPEELMPAFYKGSEKK